MDPIVLNAVCALVGAAVGYAANWWQTNRKNVVNNIADEVSDLVDDLEKLTGVDIPDSLDDLSIADLKVALKALGLPVGGKKAKLLERLTTALEGME